MKIKASLIQIHTENANKQATIDRVKKLIETAGSDVVGLPELFNTIYFPQYEEAGFMDLAESIPGPTTEELASVAKRKSVVIVCPLYEKTEEGEHFCSAAVIDADGNNRRREQEEPHSRRGVLQRGIFFQVGRAELSRLPDIGRDARSPSLLRPPFPGGRPPPRPPRRRDRLRSSAVPAGGKDIWHLEVQAHAVANGYFAGVANRVGKENKISYLGNSFFADPKGNIIAEASEEKEEIVTAELDLDLVTETRRGWQFYRDRHPETYGPLIHKLNREKDTLK